MFNAREAELTYLFISFVEKKLKRFVSLIISFLWIILLQRGLKYFKWNWTQQLFINCSCYLLWQKRSHNPNWSLSKSNQTLSLSPLLFFINSDFSQPLKIQIKVFLLSRASHQKTVLHGPTTHCNWEGLLFVKPSVKKRNQCQKKEEGVGLQEVRVHRETGSSATCLLLSKV